MVRLEQLKTWIKAVTGENDFCINAVAGDASFRRYYRVTFNNATNRIVMDAPPEKEDSRPFLQITDKLLAAGLHVPQIYAENLEQGFLLLEDLGDELYLDQLNPQSVALLYGDAIGALIAIQACADPSELPCYDESLLRFELRLFPDWLCKTHLGLALTYEQEQMMDQLFGKLIINALKQPQVFVHRDYHSRNLMLSPMHNPGIIDYQDAVKGPISYDLVSLLKDAYIRWPLDQIDHWVKGYVELAVQSGLLTDKDEIRFQQWFDLMGVQRHIKVAGIFARLYRRDAKSDYLAHIPQVLNYILEIAYRYKELEAFSHFIRTTLTPTLNDYDYKSD